MLEVQPVAVREVQPVELPVERSTRDPNELPPTLFVRLGSAAPTPTRASAAQSTPANLETDPEHCHVSEAEAAIESVVVDVVVAVVIVEVAAIDAAAAGIRAALLAAKGLWPSPSAVMPVLAVAECDGRQNNCEAGCVLVHVMVLHHVWVAVGSRLIERRTQSLN